MRNGRKISIFLAVLILSGSLLFIYDKVHSRIIFGIRDDFARAVPYDSPVPGIPGIRAEQCGECHGEIYEEWKTSYHAKAYTDPFFQAYWNKDDNIWICLNCHTPLEPQQPFLIEGLKGGKVHKPIQVKNPNFDPEFQKEGITCAACHVRDGVIEGPFKDMTAPHPTRYSERFTNTDICFTCHQVPSGPFQFYNGGPCSTFPEFEAGPYYKSGMICQDCHMPKINRPLVSGGPVRPNRKHLWRGGHFPEMIKQAVTIQVKADQTTLNPGETVEWTLNLMNSGAGHKIPTGDPDRYFTVSFELVNPEGEVVKDQVDTMGRWIVWWPVIVEVHENRLLPLDSRDYLFRHKIPANPKGWKLRTLVRYHIMTDKQYKKLKSKHGLVGEVPYVFVIYEREFDINQAPPGSTANLGRSGFRCEDSPMNS